MALLTLCQAAKRRERAFIGVDVLWRLKRCPRIARIRIESQNKKFNRERAQINTASDKRFGVVPIHAMPPAFGSSRIRTRA